MDFTNDDLLGELEDLAVLGGESFPAGEAPPRPYEPGFCGESFLAGRSPALHDEHGAVVNLFLWAGRRPSPTNLMWPHIDDFLGDLKDLGVLGGESFPAGEAPSRPYETGSVVNLFLRARHRHAPYEPGFCGESFLAGRLPARPDESLATACRRFSRWPQSPRCTRWRIFSCGRVTVTPLRNWFSGESFLVGEAPSRPYETGFCGESFVAGRSPALPRRTWRCGESFPAGEAPSRPYEHGLAVNRFVARVSPTRPFTIRRTKTSAAQ